MALLTFNNKGIYCKQADVYIDPWKKVDKALLTHGHADHARYGSKKYLCTHTAKPVIQYRLGKNMQIEGVDFHEVISINGVKFSFHPAGHIIGSAQIRVEYKGEIWVVSGDYKVEKDGITEDFELVPCHTFITESTFGLPVYDWAPQTEIFEDINNWWCDNAASGKCSILTGYSLGKAQRILQNIDPSIGPVFTHGAIEKVNEIIRDQGIALNDSHPVTSLQQKENYKGALIIAPPAALGTSWIDRFKPYSTAVCSGWMNLRGARRRRSVDRGFVLSDHVDWKGLNDTIKGTGAEKVFVTHGYTGVFTRWLLEQGYDAEVVQTQFEGEPREIDMAKIPSMAKGYKNEDDGKN